MIDNLSDIKQDLLKAGNHVSAAARSDLLGKFKQFKRTFFYIMYILAAIVCVACDTVLISAMVSDASTKGLIPAVIIFVVFVIVVTYLITDMRELMFLSGESEKAPFQTYYEKKVLLPVMEEEGFTKEASTIDYESLRDTGLFPVVSPRVVEAGTVVGTSYFTRLGEKSLELCRVALRGYFFGKKEKIVSISYDFNGYAVKLQGILDESFNGWLLTKGKKKKDVASHQIGIEGYRFFSKKEKQLPAEIEQIIKEYVKQVQNLPFLKPESISIAIIKGDIWILVNYNKGAFKLDKTVLPLEGNLRSKGQDIDEGYIEGVSRFAEIHKQLIQ